MGDLEERYSDTAAAQPIRVLLLLHGASVRLRLRRLIAAPTCRQLEAYGRVPPVLSAPARGIRVGVARGRPGWTEWARWSGGGMRAAEARAFRDFVIAKSPSLLRLGFLLTSDWGAAEDLLQTALLNAHRAWRRIQLDDPAPFVRRIMINAHVSDRRRRRLSEVPLLPSDGTAVPAVDDAVDGAMAVVELLAGLPPRQRAVLALRYCDDLSEVEIAEVLGCTTGTVKSQASKAIRSLRADPEVRSLCGLVEEAT